MEMPQEGFARPPAAGSQSAGPQRWRLRDGEVPTICLDLGVHLHHLAYFLTGKETVGIMADFANYSAYPNLVDNAMMWLAFEEGMSGSIWISKTAIGCRNGLRIRLFGESGSAEWYQMEPEVLHLSFLDGSHSTIDRGGKAEVSQAQRYNRFKAGHPSGFLEAFANLYCDIADALLRFRRDGSFDSPFVFGLNHAENGLRLFAAARRASEQRRWQDVFAHQRLKKSA
jgi:predicted dehydrogenase